MAKFLTKLKTELFDQQAAQGRGTWEVLEPFSYQSDLKVEPITAPTGFITDYASVPRIPIFFMLVGDIASEAAVIHDYLYTTRMYSRKDSDKILREAALTSGCPNWQAFILYEGVRIGGWYTWNKKGKK